MTKDLNTKEGRSSFLKDYLDDLLIGITRWISMDARRG